MTSTGEKPAWQCGFDLERLRALAKPFKVQHRPLVFGGFGLAKERDVAAALARQECVHSAGPGGEVQSIALFHRLKRPGRVVDFAQREWSIPAGAVYVDALASLSALGAAATLSVLQSRAGLSNLWVEIFEEDSLAKQAVQDVGLAYIASKILAGGEVKGVYGPPLAAAACFDPTEEATLAVLATGFLAPQEHVSVLSELDHSAPFAQHYSSYNKRGTWEAFALRGYAPDDPTFIIKPSEMSHAWKDAHRETLSAPCGDTALAPIFPATMRIARQLAPRLDRVRFMRLRAGGGELTRHADITDRQAGVKDGRIIRLHVPIVTNPQVLFSAWTARGARLDVRFPTGALCYLDQRKPHTAINAGSTDRIHLVVDAFANDDLRSLIRRAA